MPKSHRLIVDDHTLSLHIEILVVYWYIISFALNDRNIDSNKDNRAQSTNYLQSQPRMSLNVLIFGLVLFSSNGPFYTIIG